MTLLYVTGAERVAQTQITLKKFKKDRENLLLEMCKFRDLKYGMACLVTKIMEKLPAEPISTGNNESNNAADASEIVVETIS
jgi:hypothetical protein